MARCELVKVAYAKTAAAVDTSTRPPQYGGVHQTPIERVHMMADRELIVIVNYDDRSLDATVLMYQDRGIIPINVDVLKFSVEPEGGIGYDLLGVKDVLISLLERM